MDEIDSTNQQFRSSNNIQSNDIIVVVGDTATPNTFAYGLYNSLAHGNYVVFTGNQSFKKIAESLPYQRSNIVVVNEDASAQDLPSFQESQLPELRSVLVSRNQSDLLSRVFQGK
mmetsp:Transcript_13830/g.11800  ORF Transcript_13830/g.11800 Transcript_13830/m.11800 type:complete len:115 (+) Transcript_13830:685-1029(+)